MESCSKIEISLPCPRCGQHVHALVSIGSRLAHCSSCNAVLFQFATDDFWDTGSLTQCPSCGCSHLYRQKDFNRLLGVGLLITGIAFSYYTYGISLLVATLVDWILYRFVGDVGCCYRCNALFRHPSLLMTLPPFNLALHDHYRTIRTGNITTSVF